MRESIEWNEAEDDPTQVLYVLVARIESGRYPDAAVHWVDGAFDTVDAIFATVERLQMAGVPAPTPGQARALRNIRAATIRWLGGEPSIEERARAQPLRGGNRVGTALTKVTNRHAVPSSGTQHGARSGNWTGTPGNKSYRDRDGSPE